MSQASELVPPMSALYLPAGHTPDVLLVLPGIQKWPAMQGPVHSRLFKPGDAPYLPAAQGSGSEAPREQACPNGQMLQPSSEARLVEPSKRPAGQAIALGLPRGQ
eukprot:6324691-Prymnesium_polylepis.1